MQQIRKSNPNKKTLVSERPHIWYLNMAGHIAQNWNTVYSSLLLMGKRLHELRTSK